MSPTPEPQAAASVCSVIRACSRAAPTAPRAGIRRVLARPASGARANTRSASTRLSVSLISQRESIGVGAQEIREAQTPHEHDRADDAVALPTPSGGRDSLRKRDRRADASGRAAERDIFHQALTREAADLLE